MRSAVQSCVPLLENQALTKVSWVLFWFLGTLREHRKKNRCALKTAFLVTSVRKMILLSAFSIPLYTKYDQSCHIGKSRLLIHMKSWENKLLEFQRTWNATWIDPMPFSISAVGFPVNEIEYSTDLFNYHFLHISWQTFVSSQRLNWPFDHFAFIAEFRGLYQNVSARLGSFDLT